MFLSEPGRTSYDLQFSLFGFPVRVHPAFFILPILLGRGFVAISDVNTGVGLILVTGVFFVSILIHELGHACAFRLYGQPARIVLYWMGGLAIPDSGGPWSRRRSGALTPNQQIVISFAGPLFGLLLAALLIGIVLASGGGIRYVNVFYIPIPIPILEGTPFVSSVAYLVFVTGVVLNIFLNLLNLVPIYPLDGGQIARQIMVQMDRFDGVRNSILLSIASAIVITVLCIQARENFMAVFFGFMAYSNYQSLQQIGGPRW